MRGLQPLAAALTLLLLTAGAPGAPPAASAGAAPGGPAPGGPARSGLVLGGLRLTGTAGLVDGRLRLTDGSRVQAGAAWSTARISTSESFDAAFTVALSGPVGHADGIAFVVQNDGRAVTGGHGGSIGYGGLTHSVAVEFDTFKNPDDPDNNHVAVVTGGHSGRPHTAVAPSPIVMFGQPFRVRLSYDAAAKTMKVRLKATGAPGAEVKILTAPVDLRAAVGAGKAYVGFTGGTGDDVSTQEILDWKVKQPR